MKLRASLLKVEHRNQNFEEHDALAGKSPWLRRRRTRTLSGRKATKTIGAGEAGGGGLKRNASPRTTALEVGCSAIYNWGTFAETEEESWKG